MNEPPETTGAAGPDTSRNDGATPIDDIAAAELEKQRERLRSEVPALGSGPSEHLAGDTKPMLDVHSPHNPVHGWREFLVHIAAIAIGLLLALGLEQLAAYIHQRRQLTEARHELAMELATNRRDFEANVAESARIQQELMTDLRIIQALRSHAPVSSGKLDYSVVFFAARDGSWQAVQQSGALALMPYEQLQGYAWFYGILSSLMNSMHSLENTLQIASAMAASASPEKLAPRDLDELASETMEAQGRLENLRMFLGFEKAGFNEFSGVQISRPK